MSAETPDPQSQTIMIKMPLSHGMALRKKAARNQIRIKKAITQFHSRIMQITVLKSLKITVSNP